MASTNTDEKPQDPLDLLDKHKIQQALHLDTSVEIEIFESLASTNDYLKLQPHTKGIKICLAEQQTKG